MLKEPLGDAAELGYLMDRSHASLRDDFEVSSPGLDIMVGYARSTQGCLGARLTGAGFGGCAVALVRTETIQQFVASVMASYQSATGLAPKAYVCQASNGAEVVANR
jgi:galactokinase